MGGRENIKLRIRTVSGNIIKGNVHLSINVQLKDWVAKKR